MSFIPTSELQVGDVVLAFEGPFGTAIVKRVTEHECFLFRPYGITSGVMYSDNQTICYTGVEEWRITRRSDDRIKLLMHIPLK